MSLMTIGEFAERTRLSAKALRLYDESKLVVPERVDPTTGYRLYSETQVAHARLVAHLRQLDMPLAVISSVVSIDDGEDAARVLGEWWGQVESTVTVRRALVAYLQAQLRGEEPIMYEINLRSMAERRLLAICQHLHIGDTDAFFQDAFARLRGAGQGIEEIAGAPFLVFYGEVSNDSDGPMELCRPIDGEVKVDDPAGGIQVRVEPAHDEAYIRLPMKELGWPAMLPACDALETWVTDHRRHPAGALRQVLIADQRTATPDTPVCDLSVPLR